MKVRKRTQAERVEMSDRKMFEAATKLILELGTHKITLKEVGERAGYSRGLASSRFGSKEGLFVYLIEVHKAIVSGYMQRFTEGKTGLEAIMARVDAIDSMLIQETSNLKVIYTLWFESACHNPTIKHQIEEYNEAVRVEISTALKQGVESGEITEGVDSDIFPVIYISVMSGLIYQWLITSDKIDISSSLRQLKTYFTSILVVSS